MKRRKLKTKTYLIAFFIVLTLVIYTLIHFFYVFEADVSLIFLDSVEDVEREARVGSIAGDSFDGWHYYDKFHQSNLTLRVDKSKSAVHETQLSNSGYWIYMQNFTHARVSTGIHLKNFQFFFPHKTTLAIRFYLEGNSRIDLRFYGFEEDQVETLVIRQIGDTNQMTNSLCTQFITPPFNGLIRQVTIQAHVLNSLSVVVVDKIVLSVGDETRSKHMLFTILPTNWCKNVKLEAQD